MGKITMAKEGTERKPYGHNISRTVLKGFPTQVIVWENDTHTRRVQKKTELLL
jgi:hypothetical protein